MANAFNKEEKVAFEQILQGFEDALVLSKNVTIYNSDQQGMERQNDVIWRPMPYIMQKFSGLDQTGNFKNATQLSVPATIGFLDSVPWVMDSKELRDALQQDRLGMGARQRLASSVNTSVLNVASNQGTLVVKSVGATINYATIAEADAIMNEQGVPMEDRYFALSTRDYNAAASDLAGRQDLSAQKSLSAYERSYVGGVAGFQTYKMDRSNSIAAALGGGGITIDTQAAATNYYVPQATSTAATGETSNVDNRTQNITVSTTVNVAVGDCFTISGVNSIHQIEKTTTNQLKTFRVIDVVDGTTLSISPPIVSAQGGSDAELQYQNVDLTPAAAAAITFLNTAAAPINCFWHKDAIELLPGNLAVPSDAGASVMRGTLENGIEVVWQKQYDIKTSQTFYRLDCLYGVAMTNREMAGILLANQV